MKKVLAHFLGMLAVFFGTLVVSDILISLVITSFSVSSGQALCIFGDCFVRSIYSSVPYAVIVSAISASIAATLRNIGPVMRFSSVFFASAVSMFVYGTLLFPLSRAESSLSQVHEKPPLSGILVDSGDTRIYIKQISGSKASGILSISSTTSVKTSYSPAGAYDPASSNVTVNGQTYPYAPDNAASSFFLGEGILAPVMPILADSSRTFASLAKLPALDYLIWIAGFSAFASAVCWIASLTRWPLFNASLSIALVPLVAFAVPFASEEWVGSTMSSLGAALPLHVSSAIFLGLAGVLLAASEITVTLINRRKRA